MNLLDFIPGYTDFIYEGDREPAFAMLVSFLITFICTRAYTRLARTRGWGSTYVGNVHTHHLVFGIVLVMAAGAAMFAIPNNDGAIEVLLAIVFGIGSAFVLDEFALVFHLEDVYWEEEGRKSVDAVVIGIMFGVLMLLQVAPVGYEGDFARSALAAIMAVNLAVVLIAALKGKLLTAVFGVFIPFLALTGAIRLAEPDSIWARRFYKLGGNKIRRSIKRYKDYARVWRPRREWLRDLLGGKITEPPIKPIKSKG